MTGLFCDMKGFTSISEGMTPQGLVKVINRYLSIMSEPIRMQRGIIDKYIGDAIMAYWGPPFTAASEHAQLACSAALEMIGRVASLQSELPDLLAVERADSRRHSHRHCYWRGAGRQHWFGIVDELHRAWRCRKFGCNGSRVRTRLSGQDPGIRTDYQGDIRD